MSLRNLFTRRIHHEAEIVDLYWSFQQRMFEFIALNLQALQRSLSVLA